MIVDLTIPQSEFFLDESEYVAAVAGFGAGKTYVAITKVLSLIFKYPTIDQAYLAPSYPLIKSVFYPRVAGILTSMGRQFRINKVDHEISIRGHGRIICRTMEDPDKIVAWEVGSALMDEFDLLPSEKGVRVMNKVSARCRQKYPDGSKNQKLITTTPEGFKATYNLFKKKPLKDSKLVQMSTESNRHNLPENYIESRREQYPAQLIDAYLDGKFVNLTSGTVYYAFDRKTHNTKYIARPRETLHIGMDFNVYKMAAITHIKRDGIIYAVDELIDLRDTSDMIKEIKERYDGHPIIIYPDSSGKSVSSKGATLSDIKLLKDAGFRLKYKSTNPRIRDRVMAVNTAYEKQSYFINTKKCPIYTDCIEQQSYDKNGVPEKDGILDNPLDAGGYCIYWLMPILTNSVSNVAIGGM